MGSDIRKEIVAALESGEVRTGQPVVYEVLPEGLMRFNGTTLEPLEVGDKKVIK